MSEIETGAEAVVAKQKLPRWRVRRGDVVQTRGDAHFPSSHFEQARLPLARAPLAPANLRLNLRVRDFAALTFDGISAEGDEAHEQIRAEVAV